MHYEYPKLVLIHFVTSGLVRQIFQRFLFILPHPFFKSISGHKRGVLRVVHTLAGHSMLNCKPILYICTVYSVLISRLYHKFLNNVRVDFPPSACKNVPPGKHL